MDTFFTHRPQSTVRAHYSGGHRYGSMCFDILYHKLDLSKDSMSIATECLLHIAPALAMYFAFLHSRRSHFIPGASRVTEEQSHSSSAAAGSH